MTERTAGQAVVEALAARGVRRFYTVPGESFLEVLDAVEQHPDLTLVSCRHESGAAFAAEAEGKLTRRPAVAMATRAVGAANLAIGLGTAFEDSTPLVALLGQVDTTDLGRGAFQEVDLPRFLGQVTVRAETLARPDAAADAASRTWWAATSGRGGPAALALPADLLAQPCPQGAAELVPGRRAATAPSPRDAAELAALLAGARRPVAVLGSGAIADPAAVRALVERFGLGVYTAFRRQDVFGADHPQHLGHLALGTPPEITRALAEADVVLALGTRLDDTTTQGWTLPTRDAQVVHVDVDPSRLRAPVRLAWSVRADAGAFAAALLAAAGEPVARDWSAAHERYLSLASPPAAAQTAPGRPVHPGDAIAALVRRLPADAIVTNDAGNFSIWLHRYRRLAPPGRQLGPANGAMGYAVPAAIGAALAAPGRPVYAVAGDGGWLMTGNELETAVRLGLPLTVAVLANGSYGTIALHAARRFGRTAATDIGPVDVAAHARALGADAVTVTDPGELDDAFAPAPDGGPRVVVVRTDPDAAAPGVRLGPLLGRS